MPERRCVICGVLLPTSSPASRKYCDACKPEHERMEAVRRSAERRSLKAMEKLEQPQPTKQPRMLQKKDEDYCRKCMYKGRFSAGYLCDYYSMTGERRGTKAGFGCERRKIAEKAPEKRVCERCGVEIESKYSRFCTDCRMEFHREAARHMADVMRDRRKSGEGRD